MLSAFISFVSCRFLSGPWRMGLVFLTEHSRWAPCRTSWWLHTPACVHPSMQSGRCGRSSAQTYTGHSGAVWPGAGNSCGTPERPDWKQRNIPAAAKTSFIDLNFLGSTVHRIILVSVCVFSLSHEASKPDYILATDKKYSSLACLV